MHSRKLGRPSIKPLLLCVVVFLSHHNFILTAVGGERINEDEPILFRSLENKSHANDIKVGVIKDGHETITHRAPRGGGPFIVGQNYTVDRCDWLWGEFEAVTAWMDPDDRAERYHHQVTDAGVYYRATSHIFWSDFIQGNWSPSLISSFENEYQIHTWVSGDLHILNFGAWQNRRGNIVYGMDDYDEGTIHDFQVDILRLAISIYDHIQDTIDSDSARQVLDSFLETYVATVQSYIGNEDALTADLTKDTASGLLKNFLLELEDEENYSREKQIKKYVKHKDKQWKFKTGTSGDPKHKLVKLDSTTKAKIQDAFSALDYGATINRFGGSGGWNEKEFAVLDVAGRVNTGVGSFGVDRYFVLVSCGSCNEEGLVILDVKYQPQGSFQRFLSQIDSAWYERHFAHSAARVVEGHRKLTASTDPWTGWILLDGDHPFSVRERSPWKEDFDWSALTSKDEFVEFTRLLATSTATSHVRGNMGDAPDDFKNVVGQLLGDALTRQSWKNTVLDLAAAYHDQVQADFECFRSRVELNYPM